MDNGAFIDKNDAGRGGSSVYLALLLVLLSQEKFAP